MSGRVRGKTERRRDTNQPRKTMNIVVVGFFLWIAFILNTFWFMWTGGGGNIYENNNAGSWLGIHMLSDDMPSPVA